MRKLIAYSPSVNVKCQPLSISLLQIFISTCIDIGFVALPHLPFDSAGCPSSHLPPIQGGDLDSVFPYLLIRQTSPLSKLVTSQLFIPLLGNSRLFLICHGRPWAPRFLPLPSKPILLLFSPPYPPTPSLQTCSHPPP